MIIYNFFKYLFLSIRYNNILNKVYRDENIIEGLSKLLDIELKKDWIGRVYGVINPWIRNGKFDKESIIFELGQDMPTNIMIEKYIMERLNIASMFIRNNNLFDMLTYEIKKIDEYDNYLLIIEPIPYIDMFKYGNKLTWLLIVLSSIVFIGLVVYKFII